MANDITPEDSTMSKHTFTKNVIDDEAVEYTLNGEHLITANHDDDGWAGMDRIETLICTIAKLIGADMNESDD